MGANEHQIRLDQFAKIHRLIGKPGDPQALDTLIDLLSHEYVFVFVVDCGGGVVVVIETVIVFFVGSVGVVACCCGVSGCSGCCCCEWV